MACGIRVCSRRQSHLDPSPTGVSTGRAPPPSGPPQTSDGRRGKDPRSSLGRWSFAKWGRGISPAEQRSFVAGEGTPHAGLSCRLLFLTWYYVLRKVFGGAADPGVEPRAWSTQGKHCAPELLPQPSGALEWQQTWGPQSPPVMALCDGDVDASSVHSRPLPAHGKLPVAAGRRAPGASPLGRRLSGVGWLKCCWGGGGGSQSPGAAPSSSASQF